MSDIILASKAFERNLISCGLNNPEMLELLDLPLPAFESDELRVVYSMIVDLKAAGHQTITIDTLRMFYDSRPDFYAVIKDHGGYRFLETLNARPDFGNFALHLDEVRKRHDIRVARARAAVALEDIRDGVYNTPEEVYELLDGVMDTSDGTNAAMEQFKGLSLDWLEEQSDKFERGEFKVPGIPVKHPAMRDAFGAFWRHGSFNIWTAETGVGKSQVVHMLTRQCLEDDIPVLVLDNEMEAPEFRDRFIASCTGIPLSELATGKAYNPKSEFFRELKKYIQENPASQHLIEWRKVLDMRIERIEPAIRRFVRKYPVAKYPHKRVIVDGIKMTADTESLFAVGYLAQRLKEVAGKNAHEGLVIDATCQLQRPTRQTIKDKASNPPDHNSIGLSKLLADNAVVVAVIAKEPLPDFSGYDPTKRRIYVPKHRFHATLEANSYLLCEFDGRCSYLNPTAMVVPQSAPEKGDEAPENTPGVRVQRAPLPEAVKSVNPLDDF